MKPLYLELDDADRDRLNTLAAHMSLAERRPVRLVEVVRQLLRDAAARPAPPRLTRARARACT